MTFSFPPRRILVPIDMSKPSLAALAAAKTAVKRWGGRLELAYIQDLPLSLLGFEPEVESSAARALSSQMRDFLKWRQERLKGLTTGLKPSQVHLETRQGWPPSSIAELAKRRRCDVVVMGTHGYEGMDHVMLGSVAEAVVRRAEVPVLTVHAQGAVFPPRRVLVPYNLEPYADKALSYAANLSRSAGAKLAVLYAAPEGTWDEDAKTGLKARLTSVLGKAAAARTRLIVRHGPAAHAIIAEAASNRHDLIVLAAHRRHFWSGLVLGTTAERVLRHSPAPVLCVPSWEKPAARRRGPVRPPVWISNRIY